MSWPYPPEPALATDRFTMIVSALVGYIRTKAKPGTLWSQVYLAAARVTRLQRRFERLVVRYRAGTLLPPRPRAPRPEKEVPEPDGQAETEAQPAKQERPASLLPRHHGWLCAMVPLWAAGYGGKILYLLDHPEMRDLIAAAPQAGRLLRPLLWMTGRYIPVFLALPKRVRASRKKDPAAKDEPAPAPGRRSATRAAGAGATAAAPPVVAACAIAAPTLSVTTMATSDPTAAPPPAGSEPVGSRSASPQDAGSPIFRGRAAI